MKLKDILKEAIVKDILINTLYTILITTYFIILNSQLNLLNSAILTKCINVSSLIFLVISIVMFEIGYRKDKSKTFINGIEILVVAIFTLFIKHIPKVLECTIQEYIQTGTLAFVAYYILKSGIQYTIKKQNELKDLSDIKEIVKEEPTKKATKRKNLKVEEGK